MKIKEPMGKVIFKDGHEESIVFYRMFSVQYVHFFTETGAYSYEVRHGETIFYEHLVACDHEPWDDMWLGVHGIEKIELY